MVNRNEPQAPSEVLLELIRAIVVDRPTTDHEVVDGHPVVRLSWANARTTIGVAVHYQGVCIVTDGSARTYTERSLRSVSVDVGRLLVNLADLDALTASTRPNAGGGPGLLAYIELIDTYDALAALVYADVHGL